MVRLADYIAFPRYSQWWHVDPIDIHTFALGHYCVVDHHLQTDRVSLITDEREDLWWICVDAGNVLLRQVAQVLRDASKGIEIMQSQYACILAM